MKKVLFITAFVPSDFTAGEKTTKIMLRELSGSFDVDLVYFLYKGEAEYTPETPGIRVVKVFKNSIPRKIFNSLLYPIVHPLFSVRFNWANLLELQKLLKKENYAVIVCNYSQTFLYGRYLNVRIPKILYSMDVIAQKVSRTHGKLLQYICRWSEKYCLSIPNAEVFTVSDKDSQMIEDLYGIKARTALAYIEDQIIASQPREIHPSDYVFMGNWHRDDNLDGLKWFLEKVVPLIDFDVQIKIFGKHVPDEIRSAGNDHVKIMVMGFVDNPYELISNSRAFLSPLFSGAGVKQKVFEALACGVPVIGNEIAFEGIDNKFNEFMFRFTDENDFVECMKRDIPLSRRKTFKEEFTKSYQSETIPQYIKNKIGNIGNKSIPPPE